MKLGSRIQYDKFIANNQSNQALIDDVNKKIEWVTSDIYVIREATDGDKERVILDRLIASNNQPETETVNLQLKPGRISRQTMSNDHLINTNGRMEIPTKQTVPYKQPPPFLSKAVQFLITVTGPKVTEAVFKKRFSKCTAEGGLTFAYLSGTITDISPTFIYINGVGVGYPSDETPIVKVGDTVQHGQTITKSDVAKACPLLNEKNGQYFCGGCGCGARRKAELTNKLYYARVTCPRTPPQFVAEDELGPNIDTSKSSD